MSKDNQKLVHVAEEQQLEESKVKALLSDFGEPFQQAQELIKGGRDIVVTDESQTELMQQARERRLELKNVRVEAEKTRKRLKESALREGKAIDGMANIIKAMIVPVEQHLETQEKFAEIKRQERAAQLKAKRIEQLSHYTDDLSLYNLDDMTEEQFTKLHDQLKEQHEAKIAAEKKAEEERLQKEREEAEERERIRKENEKLKKQAEKERKQREKKEAEEREEAERVRKITLTLKEFAHNNQTIEDCEKSLKELKKTYEGLSSEDQMNEHITSAYQVSVAELKQFIIHLEERQKEEAERKAQEAKKEQERQAALAPDKDKIKTIADQLDEFTESINPSLQSQEAMDLVADFKEATYGLSEKLRTKAKEL